MTPGSADHGGAQGHMPGLHTAQGGQSERLRRGGRGLLQGDSGRRNSCSSSSGPRPPPPPPQPSVPSAAPRQTRLGSLPPSLPPSPSPSPLSVPGWEREPGVSLVPARTGPAGGVVGSPPSSLSPRSRSATCRTLRAPRTPTCRSRAPDCGDSTGQGLGTGVSNRRVCGSERSAGTQAVLQRREAEAGGSPPV